MTLFIKAFSGTTVSDFAFYGIISKELTAIEPTHFIEEETPTHPYQDVEISSVVKVKDFGYTLDLLLESDMWKTLYGSYITNGHMFSYVDTIGERFIKLKNRLTSPYTTIKVAGYKNSLIKLIFADREELTQIIVHHKPSNKFQVWNKGVDILGSSATDFLTVTDIAPLFQGCNGSVLIGA